MKLTKEQVKNIIKEEMEKISEQADPSSFPGPYIPRDQLRGSPSPAIENEASILSQLYQVNGNKPVYFQSDPYEGRDMEGNKIQGRMKKNPETGEYDFHEPDYGKYNLYIGEKSGLGYGFGNKEGYQLLKQGVTHLYFKKGDMYEPTLSSIGVDQLFSLNRHRKQMRRDAEYYGNYHYMPENLEEMVRKEIEKIEKE